MNHTVIDNRAQQITRFDAQLTATPIPVNVPMRPMPLRKRLFDLAVAVPAAFVTMPAVAALGIASALTFRKSPVFTQPRLGHGGNVIKFWKIRSLPRIAPETADKYQLNALDLPKLSHVMRYRHLDELPQLWLVLTGKMSLVGPRPEMPTLSESFDQEFVAERLTVKPGCTGMWQVSTSARKLIGENTSFDLHYVRNWTLRLDMWIAYRTILAIGFHDEIQSIDEIPCWTGASPRRSR